MHRLVVALVTLIGLTGAAFLAAYIFLFSASSDRAAALAPANTAFYVNVYLQPSAGQQMNLGGLIGRLPGFADEATLDDKVDQIVQNLLGGTGIDYRTQVKPWLGDQVAIAGWPAGDDPTQSEAVVIAAVRDQEAASTAVAELASSGDATFTDETYQGVELQVSDGGAYAIVGEMLVFGSTSDGIHAVIDVSDGDESLSGRADFQAAMDEVPTDHLASAFVDLGAIADATGVADQFGNVTTASAALVAERDGIRLSGSAPFDMNGAAPSSRDGFALGTEPSSLVDWMPEDTLAEAVVFGLRGTLEDAEAAVGASPDGEEISGALDTFRALAAFGLGIDIDADVLPLLDREVGIAVSGFDGTLPSGQLLLRPDDADGAEDALGRIAERLTAVGATSATETVDDTEITTISMPELGSVAYAVVDGIVIIGFTGDDVMAAVDAHADGTALGASAAYTRTFEIAGTRAGNEVYVDIGALVDIAGDLAELPSDARDILAQVGAFGFTAPSRDDKIEFHAVLTVDEPSAD